MKCFTKTVSFYCILLARFMNVGIDPKIVEVRPHGPIITRDRRLADKHVDFWIKTDKNKGT